MTSRKELFKKLTDLEKQAISLNTLEPASLDKIKYNDYREEIEMAKPSSKPEYWAKKGCKRCHGTGLEGSVSQTVKGNNTIKTNQVCECVTKAWHKWQEEFVEKLRTERQAVGSAEPEQLAFDHINLTTPPEAETQTHADPRHAAALGQIERLSTRIVALQASIIDLQERSRTLPHREKLAEAIQAAAQAQDAIQTREGEAKALEEQIAQHEAEAERLWAQRKHVLGQAEMTRQLLKSNAKPAIEQAQIQAKELLQELDLAKRSLSQADHQLQKKIRENEKKVDKLRSRIERVQRENNMQSSVFIAEEVDLPADQDTPTAS